MTRLTLCLNCLEVGAVAVSVGPDQGNQRDSWRETVDLCPICKPMLLKGNFYGLAQRNTMERTIIVGAQGER